MTRLPVTSSTGNVFADLGLADAGEHLIKARLVVKIDRTIRQRHLTQATITASISPRSPLCQPVIRGYSVERLKRVLVALAHDVEIVVKPRRRSVAALRVA